MESENTQPRFTLETVITVVIFVVTIVFAGYKAKTIGAENPDERRGNVTAIR